MLPALESCLKKWRNLKRRLKQGGAVAVAGVGVGAETGAGAGEGVVTGAGTGAGAGAGALPVDTGMEDCRSHNKIT